MKLTVRVVGVHSARNYTDGVARVILKFDEADEPHNWITIRDHDDMCLDSVIFFNYGSPAVPENSVQPPVVEMTLTQAHAELAKAYPLSSMCVKVYTWRYNHGDQKISVSFDVSVQPGPREACEIFSGATLAAAVVQAIAAKVPVRQTTIAEADALV